VRPVWRLTVKVEPRVPEVEKPAPVSEVEKRPKVRRYELATEEEEEV
jgi:hypothetical protein